MTKTKEELNKLKDEYKELGAKLKELSEDEFKKVVGGNDGSEIKIPGLEYIGPYVPGSSNGDPKK